MFQIGEYKELDLSIFNKYNINSILEVKPELKQLKYWGNVELLNNKKISIVGSRKISYYGKKIINYYVDEFVRNDVVVVSGGMYGVDFEAHLKTLEKGGDTIMVLGYGVDFIILQKYLQFIKPYVNEENILVLTEFADSQPPEKWTFPKRNRLVAAIGDRCLIVEASKGSGSLITADIALELGKEVFVIPGDIFSHQSAGKHLLIKQGAILTDSPSDLLSVSDTVKSSGLIDISDKPEILNNIEQKIITSILDGNNTINSLLKSTDIPLNELTLSITNLELEQIIKTNLLGEIEIC